MFGTNTPVPTYSSAGAFTPTAMQLCQHWMASSCMRRVLGCCCRSTCCNKIKRLTLLCRSAHASPQVTLILGQFSTVDACQR